jgi:hypothetical protein
MQAEAIKLIDKTIEVLERDGWCRGSYTLYDPEPHCLIGALHVATYGYLSAWNHAHLPIAMVTAYEYTKRRISEHIAAHYPKYARAAAIEGCVGNPEAWNDTVATSREEVIEMLNHCKFHMLRTAEMAVRPWPEVPQTAAA